MSSVLFSNPSIAFSSSQSFFDFFFLYRIVIASSCSFVGLCFGVTLVVVCMRRFMCFDAEEEERKPLALKVQDRVDAAQWGVKSSLQLLIGLAVFGLSAATIGTPVVTFPDGYEFYYLARCRGDVCQQWVSYFVQTCQFMTLTSQGGDKFCRLALIFAGTGGAVYVLILVIELSRRCCSNLCLGFDPDGDLGNPSKGYFPRWLLLFLRIAVLCLHAVAVPFTVLYAVHAVDFCDSNRLVEVNMITAGGRFGNGFYCLCVALGLEFIDICLDGILGEVGRFVVLSPEDEIALKEIVTPSPTTILPIITKPNNNDFNNNHPKNPSDDDDAKKLIQQQQIAMDKLKKEMAEEKQKFMLALQQKNLQQQQQQKQHLPSAQPETQLQHNAGVDPNNHQQQQHHEEIDHQHDAEFAEQQKQILALQQLVEQLQHQHDTENKNTTTVVTIDPNPPLPHQTDDSQTLQPQQNQSPLKPLNTDSKINPLAAAPPDAANDNDDDHCRVDVGSEKTDKKKKHDKSSKSVRKHHDNEPDSVSTSRREKFEAQQRMIQQLKDEQQALIDKLQTEGGNDQTNNGNAEASQGSKQ